MKGKKTHLLFIALIAGLLVYLGWYLILGKNTTSPKTSLSPSGVRNLTRELLRLKQKYYSTETADRSAILKTAKSTAIDRYRAMYSLARKNPEQFYNNAMPRVIRDSFPPEVKKYIEQPVNKTGTLQEFAFDDAKTKTARKEYYLSSGSQKYPLYFTDDFQKATNGSKLSVNGWQIGSSIVSSTDSTNILAAAKPPPPQTNKLAVLLINFQDNTSQPFTTETVNQTVLTGTNSVKAFYLETSYNQYAIDATVFGWYTIPNSSATCNFYNWATPARTAATNAGVNLSAYTKFIYVLPNIPSCNWSGVSEQGGSNAWVNGHETDPNIFAHEFGHELGLYHASIYDCKTANGIQTQISETCTYCPYNDHYDVMSSQYRQMSTYRKAYFGWLPQTNIQTITSSGVYTIVPAESASAGIQALKILREESMSTDWNKYFWVEYRQNYGTFDQFPTYKNVTKGVSIRLAYSENVSEMSYLIDSGFHTIRDSSDAAFEVGKTFVDPVKNITVKTLSATATEATVEVNFGPVPCVKFKPIIKNITDYIQPGQPGEAVNFSLTLANTNSAACPPANYDLSLLLPTEGGTWSGSLNSSNITLASGQVANLNATITSPTGLTQENYHNIALTATDPTDTANFAKFMMFYWVRLVPTAARITKSSNIGSVNIDGEVTFNLLAENPTTSNFTNILIVDRVPAGMNFVTDSQSTGCIFDSTDNSVKCTLASLIAGQSANFSFRAKALAP